MESLDNKLMEELLKGKEYTKQLQELLLKPFGDDGSVLAQELGEKILRSFTDSLTEVKQIEAPGGGGYARGARRSQDSGQSKRPEVVKYRRGCYKRRRATEHGVQVSATMEDGYAWRKYGQKEILKSKYPRCYFRCTHKYDQGCQATKQVQRVDDHEVEDVMYQITYFGNHTCNDRTRAPQIILNYSDSMNNCFNNPLDHHSSQMPTTVPKEGTQSNDLTDDKSSMGSTMWQDLIGPESPSMGSYNHDEVASSLYTSGSATSLCGLDMKTLSCFTDFDNHDFTF